MKNTKTLWTVGLALLACATGAAYWYTVSFMKWNVPLYVVGMALLSDDCSAMYCGKHWDCNGSGFLLGGGRDLNVYDNVLINCKTPIAYDDRSREAVIYPWLWFTESREGGILQ